MKKIIILMAVFVVACSTANYNTPFINTKETTQLEFGLSRADIVETIGKPLFVNSGGDGKVVWVYEVRTTSVASDVTPTGEVTPKKNSSNIKHDSPIHELALIFSDGRLSSWGDYDSYNPDHTNGFYFDCFESGGCGGDIDGCGNCVASQEESEGERGTEETSKPFCCGDNLYLIGGDGEVTIEEKK